MANLHRSPSVVIVGAGIAGVATAYHLAVKRGVRDVLLVDSRPPLSLTSDKSTEAYRNWWPGPDGAMVGLMSRSIDLLEALADAHGNRFLLNRRGYLFLTADPARVEAWRRAAAAAEAFGAGPLREHTTLETYRPAPPRGFHGQPDGADLLLGEAVHRAFPYVSPRAVAALHVRRAGWLSAHTYGTLLLEEARARGVRLVQARYTGAEVRRGRVEAVSLSTGERVPTGALVLAVGPFLRESAAALGVALLVVYERHLKVAFDDRLGAVPRAAPLLIWSDPQRLPWSDDERAVLAADPGAAFLLDEFPGGVHTRPEGEGGSRMVIGLWEYNALPLETARFPVPDDPFYPEAVLRGLSTMLPAMRPYLQRLPRPVVDGGYYVKMPDNRPVVGPLAVEGAYVVGALSGFGIMGSQGAADLLAAHLTGEPLPPYAAAFRPERWAEVAYRQRWEAADSTAWEL
ncbi:MAG TPA: FAD-binding oxidoreductase [Chloroflexi bacterium]|nr:FAD-binding oxidoreductase [Chloroflexota bacterium]